MALGALFALSFCPVSAALYFGSLIPLAMQRESPVLLPALYGMGTAVPVLALAFLAAAGFQAAGGFLHGLGQVEAWARRITAAVFVAVGLYFVLNYNLELFA